MSSILGNFLAGQQAGRQQHQYRQEQSKLAQLQQLAPSVLAGDPAAYGKAAALDIDQANKLQGGRDGQLRRFGGFIKFIDEAKAGGDPRRLSAAMREAAPYLQQLGAPAFDPNAPWTPEYDAGWEALKAQYEGAMAGGGGGTLQSQKIGDDGFIYNTFRDGRMVNTGVRADRQMWFRDHPGMEPQLVGKDGSVQTVGAAGQGASQIGTPAAPGRADMEADIELANSMITAGIPEAQVDAFLAQRGQRAPAPAVASGSFGTPASASLARPSQAQEAAATERAKLQAQAEYLPQELAMRGQAAVDQAVGIERGKNEAERDAQAPKRIQSYQQALAASQNVATSIDKALGMIGPMSTGFLGARSRGIEGSPAYNLAAEIETVKANLGFDRLQQMRDNSPTGGALGAIAVQELVALQSTIANLDPNQSADQLRANLGRVKEHYDRWKATVQQALAEEQSQQRRGGQGSATQAGSQRTIVRTGTSNGRKVVQYSDGSVEYGN